MLTVKSNRGISPSLIELELLEESSLFLVGLMFTLEGQLLGVKLGIF